MNAVSKLFVAAALLFTANFASAQTCPSFTKPSAKTLTAEQCTKLRSDLDQYIAYVNAWLAAQPVKKQALLKPLVDFAIAEAKKYVNKVCPLPPGNGYSTNSPNVCVVTEPQFFQPINLGLSSTGQLVNVPERAKTVCMSANACSNIVSAAFIIFGPQVAPECQDPANTTVQHLTDAEVQTKVNSLLGQ